VRLELDAGLPPGKIVAELKDVSMRFGERTLIDHFSATILRGDKVGLIGPNGCGKTTLLKLILGRAAAHLGQRAPGHAAAGGLLRPDARRARTSTPRWPTPSARAASGSRSARNPRSRAST
jgi:ATPase subunit of ABC transporter with duplicated ATPase domains